MTRVGCKRRCARIVSLAATVLLVAPTMRGAMAQATGDTSGQDASAGARSGAQVYSEICQACHMRDAEGGKGAVVIPALARNAKLADADWLVATVLKGRGGMPAFAGILSPDQISDVLTYVRTNFGNDYAKPVTVEDVKRLAAGSNESSE